MLYLKFSMAFSSGSETVPRGIPRQSKSNRLLNANSADLLSITGSTAGNGVFRTATVSFLCLLLTLAFPLLFFTFSFVRFSFRLLEIDLFRFSVKSEIIVYN